jgi:signal peptidase I
VPELPVTEKDAVAHAPEPDSGAASAATDGGRWSAVRETVIVVVLALALATIIRVFLVQAFLIPSSSMENTLLVGDRVLVSKLTTRFGEIERGDVVVFTDPGGWLGPQAPGPGGVRGVLRDAFEFIGVLPSDAEGHLIKRVIGVGGDRIRCCDAEGRLLLNGTPVEETSILKPGVKPSREEFAVTVPTGELWVMGDNRPNSGDSRIHGPVPVSDVVGRTVAVVWPPSSWGSVAGAEQYSAAAEAKVDTP